MPEWGYSTRSGIFMMHAEHAGAMKSDSKKQEQNRPRYWYSRKNSAYADADRTSSDRRCGIGC